MFNSLDTSSTNNDNKMNFVENNYAYHPNFLLSGSQFGCGQQQQPYQQPLTNSFGVFGDYNVNNVYYQPSVQPQQQPIEHLWPFSMQNGQSWTNNNIMFNHYDLNNSANSIPVMGNNVISPTIEQQSQWASCSISNDLNVNNKRHIDTVSDYDQLSVEEFDFDSRRPVKKYICEEKVLEIFDRLHIREGNHYIVEDVPDEEACPPKNNPFRHNVSIEEVFDNEDCQLEFSTQLKDALQVETDITNKLIKFEQEKLAKALVLYRPNSILDKLKQNCDSSSDKEESSAKKSVKVEEISSDNDDSTEDQMLAEEDMPNDGVFIEQLPSSDEDSCTDIVME